MKGLEESIETEGPTDQTEEGHLGVRAKKCSTAAQGKFMPVDRETNLTVFSGKPSARDEP